MKKISITVLSMALVLAALVFGLVSCDNGATGPAGFNAVGTWKLVSSIYWGNRLPNESYVFKSDMTYENIYDGKVSRSGTWDYTDTGIVILTGFGSGPMYTI